MRCLRRDAATYCLLPRRESRVGRYVTEKCGSQEPRLDLEEPSVGDLIIENRMADLGCPLTGAGFPLLTSVTTIPPACRIDTVVFSVSIGSLDRIYKRNSPPGVEMTSTVLSPHAPGMARREIYSGQASRRRFQVAGSASGITRSPAMVVMKLVSPFQRGRTWMWKWPGMPAPAAAPMLVPTLIPWGA